MLAVFKIIQGIVTTIIAEKFISSKCYDSATINY